MSWRLTDPDDSHYTHDDGRRWPRVSTVAGEWQRCAMPANIPAHVLDEAARLGTVVHAGVASVLTGVPVTSLPTISPRSAERATRAVRAWDEWRRRLRPEPVAVEERLVDEAGQVIGTADYIGRVSDVEGLGVIDWKTSATLHLGGKLALAQYVMAARANGYPVEWGRLVRLAKDEEAHPFEERHFTIAQLGPSHEAFRLLRRLYHLWEARDV